MGAVCPTRKAAAFTKEETTSAPLKETAGKDAFSAPRPSLPTAGKATFSAPNPLPVKSWRALLEEADSNSDPKTVKVPAPTQSRVPKRSIRSQHVPGTGARETSAEGIGKCNGIMMAQTETYMKLLKEGGSIKKSLLPYSTARNKATVLAECPTSAPMTAASLKETWQTALQMHGNAPGEDTPKIKSSQDDISVEKSNDDRDISDPAYWSDTDKIDKAVTNVSAHSLGRSLRRRTTPSYVMQDLSFDIDRAVGLMLCRLQYFSERQQTICESGGKRRFVFGLKEVIRRVKQLAVSCVIVAPDLESNPAEGGLDDRVREVIALAYEKNVPVIFALSRSRLGLASGSRSRRVLALGILDTTGAQDLFKTALELSDDARQSWLARLPLK